MSPEQISKLYMALTSMEKSTGKPYSILEDIDRLMVANSKKETILLFKQSVTRLSAVSSQMNIDEELQAKWDESLSSQVKSSVNRLKRLGE